MAKSLKEEWDSATPISLEDEWESATPIQDQQSAQPSPGVIEQAGETVKNIGKVYPAVETVANLATSAYGLPVSGLAGALTLPVAAGAKALGLTNRDPVNVASDVVKGVQNRLIYQPQTEGGQQLTEAATYPMAKLDQAGSAVGGRLEMAGYPNAGAAVHSAITGAPALIPGLKMAKNAAFPVTAETLSADLSKAIRTGVEKSIRPSVIGQRTFPQMEKYLSRAETAVKSIIENKDNLELSTVGGETLKGKLPQTLKQFSQAVDQTKGDIFRQYDALAKQTGRQGAAVDLGPIVSELRNIGDDAIVSDLNPRIGKYATDLADRLEQRGIYTAGEAQKAISTLNNSLDAFYKNPSFENASQAQIDAMVVNKLRSSLDTVIDNATGADYQALKNTYGALKTIERDVNRRAIVDARKNPKGLIDFSDMFSGSQVVHGIISLNPGIFASGVVTKAIASTIKFLNDPNRMVKSMFGDVEQLMHKSRSLTP